MPLVNCAGRQVARAEAAPEVVLLAVVFELEFVDFRARHPLAFRVRRRRVGVVRLVEVSIVRRLVVVPVGHFLRFRLPLAAREVVRRSRSGLPLAARVIPRDFRLRFV